MSSESFAATYIMADRRHGVIYIGSTGDLARRALEHREGAMRGFAKRYGCKRLVWFEVHEDYASAAQREKSLKKWPRDWKANLIERDNPNWEDLYGTWI